MKETLYLKTGKGKLRILAKSEALPNFALCALPSFPATARERLVSALLKLKPLTNAKDAETVKNWDDEVRNGFVEPGSDFIPSILNLYSIYWEITNVSR
jgi:ABC-type phosphate/phosphonate transport system substrate-binding protein